MYRENMVQVFSRCIFSVYFGRLPWGVTIIAPTIRVIIVVIVRGTGRVSQGSDDGDDIIMPG